MRCRPSRLQALYTAHVGDTGAVLDRGGTAYRLTVDHKPNTPAERERIEAQGGQVEPHSNRVISQEHDGKASLLAMSR